MTICYCRKSAMHSSRVRVCWTLDLTVPVAVVVVIHSDFHQPLCCSKSGVSTPSSLLVCLQCSDAGWAAGRASGLQKTEWWGAGIVICLEQGADLHMAQLMPLPLTVCCFSKIQIGFTFLVPADLGSPGQRAVKRVCVCLVVGILVMRASKKVKFSHTRYRALGPELIPVYRQPARRWHEVIHTINPAVVCHCFLPGLRLPSQLSPDGATCKRQHTPDSSFLLILSTPKGWKAELA